MQFHRRLLLAVALHRCGQRAIRLQKAKSQLIGIKQPSNGGGTSDGRQGRALAIAMIASAYGQDYPVKPITWSTYAAGGPADLLARTVAAGMGDLLGSRS